MACDWGFVHVVEDLKTQPIVTTPETSIDGEYTAYRAIQPFAVFALIFGILSILCLLDLSFWPVAALGLACGLFAIRRIRRLPTILTGEPVAKLGIAFALGFILIAASINLTQYGINRVRASQFGDKFAGILRDNSVEEILWWELPAQGRRASSPKEHYNSLIKSAPSPEMVGPQLDPIRELKARLASTPGQILTFAGVRDVRNEQLDVVAMLGYEIQGPTSADFAEAKQEAVVILKGSTENGVFDWRVESIRFPAKGGIAAPFMPKSRTAPPRAASKLPSAKSETDPHDHGK